MRFTAFLFQLLVTATLAIASLVPANAAGTAESYAEARKAFQEAYARVSADVKEPAADDSAILRAYPLYPYLEAARIRQALGGPPDSLAKADERAAEFLSAYAQAPVSRPLRRSWLESLARRSLWAPFLAAYRDAEATEALRCQGFVARIELGKTAQLAGDIAKQWLTPRSLPDCERPFAWMKENGVLTTQLIEERIRLALKDGNAAFARQLIPQLPAERAAPLVQWAALIERPARSIDKLIAEPDTRVEAEVLLAGWSRLARTDRAGAKERYDRFVRARGLNREAASRYALALALPLAWDRDSAALDYFGLVAPADLDDTALEWWARAALWSKNWPLASRIITRMSESTRQTARWSYWAARTAEMQKDSAASKRIYEALLPRDNYYSAMAAARLDRPVIPHPEELPQDARLLAAIGNIPAMERARELFLCGMRSEALAEWRVGYDALPEGGQRQAIHLAAGWGWYDQAVAVAVPQGVFNDYALLYPRPFEAEVGAAARQASVEPDIVYGIVRQESLYRVDAVSSAGARGLMQLMPDTARRTARHWKRSPPAITDLLDPSINTALGTAHLRMLLDRFGGQLPLALAGYNAGPNAVVRWLPPQEIDPDIWIENIPYNETRIYVQRILWHQLMFAWLRSEGEAQRTDSWLKSIRPVG